MAWLKGERKGNYIDISQSVRFSGDVISNGTGADFAPARTETYYVDGVDGDNGREGKTPSTAFETIEYAVSKSGNDDRIYIAGQGDWMRLAAAVDWSYNDGRIIGNAQTPMQPRLDIGMAYTSTFNPMFTVSGRGNVLANLTFRHGSETAESSNTGYATDLTCMLVSGRYNYFDNVYFYTPLYSQQDVAATYKGVQITGHNNYFRGCKFGSDGLERDQANWNLAIEGGIGNVFEDCIFQMGAGGTAPFFVRTLSTARDMKYNIFKNCIFYAHSANYGVTPSYAIDADYQANTAGVVLDNCNFVNVGQISDANKDSWIWKSMYEGENGADTTKVGMIALRNQGV